MNTALKHWKEAATLILAAGHRLGAPLTAAAASGARAQLPHTSGFDYDVLLLKRSGKSGFMPNAYVFPGGMVDASDFSDEWLDVFRRFTSRPGFGLTRVKQPADTRPPIFGTDRRKLGSSVPGEVAFRICALRETFEESGILLIVSEREEASAPGRTRRGPDPAPLHEAAQLRGSDLSRWRTLVIQDPSNFVRMCRELQVLPNIWALHEWSNWLTPRGRYAGTRFDAAFFLCCLRDVPHTLQDDREIATFQWSTPSEVLRSHQAQELYIPPPQFYELSRLRRLPSLSDLHDFASQRASEGCERWLPVALLKDEQHISLLPGDKLYSTDASGEATLDVSSDPHRDEPEEGGALHRVILSGPYAVNIQITFTPKYKHLLPLVDPVLSHISKSQL